MTSALIEPIAEGRATLRSLTREDLPITLAWRNHDESREWFHTTEIIDARQHAEWFDRYLTKTDDFVFIIEVDGEPVAQSAIYDVSEGQGEFGRLLVAPHARGRGLGHLAMELTARAARESFGLSRIALEVKDTNARAIAVYARAGFERKPDSACPPGSTVWVRTLL